MKTNKKGISLIVLAITIIVMIILATAIILSLSSNDMVASAKEATSASDMANVKHVVAVAKGEFDLGEVEGSLKSYVEEKLLEAGFKVSGNGGLNVSEKGIVTKIYEDKSGKVAYIPDGYVASEAKGEDTIADGLVIYQGYEAVTDRNVETAKKERNQFVWVPVDRIEDFKRINYAHPDSNYATYDIENITTETRSYNLADPTEAAEYMAMYNSVDEYKGFYIARYEAGTTEERTGYSQEGSQYAHPIYNTMPVVIQKDKYVYNFTDYNTIKDLCSGLSTDSAVGHLIYGEEWDATIEFISTSPKYPNYETNNNGNYGEDLLLTGSNSPTSGNPYSANNIHDMAGNAFEITMEVLANDPNTTVMRSGYWANPCMFVGYRCSGLSKVSSNTGKGLSFRPALYLK